MAASSTTDNWSAERYSTNASFVYSAAFTNKAIALLSPQPGVRLPVLHLLLVPPPLVARS